MPQSGNVRSCRCSRAYPICAFRGARSNRAISVCAADTGEAGRADQTLGAQAAGVVAMALSRTTSVGGIV
jgi:hypothetical protein